ncbi:MAG: ethanolamine ammonia-lyase subunit EutC [Burkholderiaceae bacterium]
MADAMHGDPWHALRRYTAARIALGRAGASLPTAPMLEFQLAHAQARDAVHLPFDATAIAGALERLGLAYLRVRSAAPARESYLRRPDLGRRLDDASREALRAAHGVFDAALVIADGLSPLAAHRHAVPLLALAREALAARGWRVAPVVIAEQSRVALGDEIGEALGAGIVAVLIGERPGLSSPDSLGVYLTFEPRRGRADAQRNCISNVRPEGLPIVRAAHTLVHLMLEARTRGLTGVQLKDDSDAVPLLVRPDDGGLLDA